MERKIYDDEFKKQIVELSNSKTKKQSEISREYGVTVQSIRSWSKQYKKTKTFGVRAGLSPVEKEVIEL